MTRKEPRRCVFCGKSPVTGEHVFPRWIEKAMVKRFGKARWRTKGHGKDRNVAKLDAVVNQTCEGCNTGWMSELEDAVKPVLLPMMLGQQASLELETADQADLAAWAFKTAMMGGFIKGNRSVLPATCKTFFRDRRAPQYCTIWTAAYAGNDPRLVVSNSETSIEGVSYSRDGVIAGSSHASSGITCTLMIFRAIFHVLIYEGYHLPLDRHRNDGQLLWQIWPTNSGPIGWPAAKRGLNEDGFWNLATHRIDLRVKG